jgi:uncharacterized membrane protein
MAIMQETIDVNVPAHTAYAQWTQFEEFPRFMENVEEVQQLDPTTLRWRASIAGTSKQWQAQITEQVPDRRIAWESTSGARNDGVVTFDRVAADLTRVTLQLNVEPDGPMESAGTALGLVSRSVHGDLERFRDFIEARGSETGAWRGEVHDGAELRGSGTAPGHDATASPVAGGAPRPDAAGPDTTRSGF